PGRWGTRIAVKIEDATLKSPDRPLFKLTVMYWSKTPPQPVVDPTLRDKLGDPNRREPTVLEVPYDNLSPDPESQDYFKKLVNGISNLIELEAVPTPPGTPPTSPTPPGNIALTMLHDPNDNPQQFDGSAITADDYNGKTREFVEEGETVVERSG